MPGAGPFPLGSPIGLAHRGGAAEAVENSPSAFQRAWDLGFRFIETDVRSTADGHAIVFHDDTLDRTTDASGPLASTPLHRVLSSHLASGEHPMTLADALRRWSDVCFNVDVKSDDTVGPFLRAVSETDAWDRVCAASFSTARLDWIRSLAGPRLATSMGTREVAALVLAVPHRSPACAAQVPRGLGVLPVVTPRLVRRAHARGLAVHVWTINDRDVMEGLISLGVDGIVTDRPSLLREVLVSRGLWP